MKCVINGAEWFPVYELIDPSTRVGWDVKEIDEALVERYRLACIEFFEVQRLLGNDDSIDFTPSWLNERTPQNT